MLDVWNVSDCRGWEYTASFLYSHSSKKPYVTKENASVCELVQHSSEAFHPSNPFWVQRHVACWIRSSHRFSSNLEQMLQHGKASICLRSLNPILCAKCRISTVLTWKPCSAAVKILLIRVIIRVLVKEQKKKMGYTDPDMFFTVSAEIWGPLSAVWCTA